MKKVKHTLGDGTVEYVWEETFDGLTIGFNCKNWTLQDAVRAFDNQVRDYKESNRIQSIWIWTTRNNKTIIWSRGEWNGI